MPVNACSRTPARVTALTGEIPKRTYGLEAMAGFDKKDYRMSGLRYENLRPGNYIGAEHLKDMDIDGVWASVCSSCGRKSWCSYCTFQAQC